MAAVHAVIMAGGSGTRFWPASRQARPKQLLPLVDGKPMVAATVDRLAGTCRPEHIWIATNKQQKRPLAKLLLDFPLDQILVEPEPRDTAPCVALATARIAATDPDATIVVLPADQAIGPVSEFERMLARAVELAADGRSLITFGVPPTFAATGYGYIELGDARDDGEPRAHAVRSFREKPDAATAQQFVDSGSFWWNSGILVYRVDAILRAMRSHAPELHAATEAMCAAIRDGRPRRLGNAFRSAPKTSIDYALLERADDMTVVECTASWDDVGGFPALQRVLDGDAADNHLSLHDGADAQLLASKDNVVYVDGKRTVALFGVEGLVVAAVDDAVLVCPKDRAADLKQLVEHLRQNGRADLL